MSAQAMVFMALICGLVWGGFAALLVRAVGRESAKSGEGEEGRAR